VSTVAEIEAAIKALPPAERERLAEDLPSILPELRGDLTWQRIIANDRPRAALTALGDQIKTQFKANPDHFPEVKESDLDRDSRSPEQLQTSGNSIGLCRTI
jgi:hypothetical protein